MSSSSDEDDKFLYGSDEESTPSERKRTSENETEKPDKRPKLGKTVANQEIQSSEAEGSESDAPESDSDSDVEFIISTGADTTRLDSVSAPGSQASGITQTSGISVATAPPDATEISQEDTPVSTNGLTTDQQPTTESTIDLNAEGTFDGVPVTSLDPEVLKEKPWRQPGANLSDYFNYGFNEYTWMEYLNKQEKLRQEYNPHKILMGLMALQQNGKLNGNSEGGMDVSGSSGNVAGRAMAPPGFPPLPMFGGFSPFGMPGMMMNQGQKK